MKSHNILIVLIIYLALLSVSRLSSINVGYKLQDTITLSLGILYEAFPFVILGVLLSTLIQRFVSPKLLTKILPKNRFSRRATLSVSGSFLPVCECGNVPLARGLMRKGISPQEALTFILAAPIINPVTALTTWHAFPSTHEMLYFRLIAAFFIANFVGWVFEKYQTTKLVTDEFQAVCNVAEHGHRSTNKKSKFKESTQHIASTFQTELTTLLPALAGGSLLAGTMQTFIPRSWLLQLASEPLVAILAMISLAFVISICANVDAFFALSLSGIFPLSALLAFLVFGPMIDLKMLALLRTTYRSKVLLQLTIVVFLLSIAAGLVAHYVL